MSNGDRAPSDIVHQGDTGPSGSSSDRTPLMAIPEIRQLSTALVENGYGDLIDKTEAFLEIDTTAMKVAALVSYGVPDQGSRDVAPPTGTPLPELGNLDPDHFLIRNASNTLNLEQFSRTLRRAVERHTGNRWQGAASEAFVDYMNQVEWAINREGERLRTIGQALYEVADAIEQAQDDAEMTFWGAVGLALTSKGLTTALLTSSGVLGALVGGLTTAASRSEQAAARASDLASQETDSKLELRHPEYMEQGPREHLTEHEYSKNPEDWRIDRDG